MKLVFGVFSFILGIKNFKKIYKCRGEIPNSHLVFFFALYLYWQFNIICSLLYKWPLILDLQATFAQMRGYETSNLQISEVRFHPISELFFFEAYFQVFIGD